MLKPPQKSLCIFIVHLFTFRTHARMVGGKKGMGGGAQSALYKGASLRNLGHRHIWNLKHIYVDPVENRVSLIVGPPPRLTSF